MRILIADDDSTSRLVLKAAASRLGHECLVAEDGSSAWDLLSTGEVDVLLTDWMMPGVDGPELCRRVRRELSGQYVYIVLITSLNQREQVMNGMTAGADDYLIKPIDPFNLQTRLIAAERVTALHRQLIDTRAELEKANLELLGYALTDPLTGLGNRRRMEEELAKVHAQASRNGQPFSVALFDIDHFKLYNDHYGHPAGDDALQQVAECLQATKRKGESAYRYGGEEFLLVLSNCSGSDALSAANRARLAVANRAIPHDVRPTTPPVLTLSGGTSTWEPASKTSVADLVQQADRALFLAKSAGRNQVQPARTSSAVA